MTMLHAPSFMGTAHAGVGDSTQTVVSAKASYMSETVGSRTRQGFKEQTRLQCPHCAFPCLVRTSAQVTALTRESMYSCSNPECGHTFVALTEIVRTLSPSATPNPSINLPLSSHVRRDLLRATVEHAASASHKPHYTTPVNGDLFAGGTPTD